MDLGLKDKVALVTAASRGIGAAAAHELAAEGARVVLYQPEAKYDPFPAKVAEAIGLGKKAFSVRKSMAE